MAAVLSRLSRNIYLTLALLTLLCTFANAAVLAIDYGQEWTKAALVKPGVPMEIVLTRDSKRKEMSVVAFKGDERLYGQDAFNLAARKPESVYPGLKSIMGQLSKSEIVEEYLALHPSTVMVPSKDRPTVTFKQKRDDYTLEELLAMQFTNMKSQAEAMANGESIRDAIITTPPFLTQSERRALIDAAEIAGLRVLELMSDGAAIGVNYATGRNFGEEGQWHVVYDMGAGSTSASVVSFRSASVKDVGRYNKTVTQINVEGVGYDRNLGGDAFNTRLVEHFTEVWEQGPGKKAGSSIRGNGRAMAKLAKEAVRVKQVLSANTEARLSIESFHEDIDFRARITRAEFESLTADLASRVTLPIQTALAQAGLSISQIESVILAGGNNRIPAIQRALENEVGADKIAKNVNADEAAVMGAVFRGAGLSGLFKVKEIQVGDVSLHPVEVGKEELFGTGALVGSAKNVTFKESGDFKVDVKYAPQASLPTGMLPEIFAVNVGGVKDALAKVSCSDPAVKVTFEIDNSGLVGVQRAFVECEVEDKKNLAGKLKGLFGSKEDSTSSDSSASASATPSAEADAAVGNKKAEIVSLTFEIVHTGVMPYGTAEKAASIKKLQSLDQLDRKRHAREEARNGLEAYIYRTRDQLDSEDFDAASSDSEKKVLQSVLDEVTESLYEDGDTATREELLERMRRLEKVAKPISERVREHRSRPEKVAALEKVVENFKRFVEGMKEQTQSVTASASTTSLSEDDLLEEEGSSSPAASATAEVVPPLFGAEELEKISNTVTEVEKWLTDNKAAQAALKLWDAPAFLTQQVEEKAKQLQDELTKMLNRKPPKAKKNGNGKKSATRTASASDSSTSATAKASTSAAPETHDEL
ncbi:lumenal Hsp70 protein [Saitoella coloradoensis]